VLLLQRDWSASLLRHLAPVGRMALTNYLFQSVVSSLVFFGYGFGFWGIGRARQVLYVLAVFSLQVLLSRWWMGKFRYGPMEWLWRAFTYWQLPAMRKGPAAPSPGEEIPEIPFIDRGV
jgi:uncharacterized protein